MRPCAVCSTNLGFSGENTNLGVSVGYVLCTRYVCAERSQGSMHREVSMHESGPEQQRGREQWFVLSGTTTIGHGLHVADRAQGLTGT